jgi:uncharacterized protein (DUF2267 family)
MQDPEFVEQVQMEGGMPSVVEAQAAIHATLTALGERLAGGAADNLAAQLPPQTARHLAAAPGSSRPGWPSWRARRGTWPRGTPGRCSRRCDGR